MTVNAGGYTDAVGNTGGSGSDTVAIDRANPTLTVTVASEPLTDGSPSTLVTFQFSEAINAASFTQSDIGFDPAKGTLSAFTQVDANTWTVTYTAIDGFDGSDTISVAAGSYTDIAGNSGGGGSDTVAIDRFEAPTADPNDFDNIISGGPSGTGTSGDDTIYGSNDPLVSDNIDGNQGNDLDLRPCGQRLAYGQSGR